MVYKFGPFPTGVDSCSLRYCGGGEAGEAGKWHINQLWTDHYLSAGGGGKKYDEFGCDPPLRLYNIVMVPLSLEVDWQSIFFGTSLFIIYRGRLNSP